jgi:hypothetical protein
MKEFIMYCAPKKRRLPQGFLTICLGGFLLALNGCIWPLFEEKDSVEQIGTASIGLNSRENGVLLVQGLPDSDDLRLSQSGAEGLPRLLIFTLPDAENPACFMDGRPLQPVEEEYFVVDALRSIPGEHLLTLIGTVNKIPLSREIACTVVE